MYVTFSGSVNRDSAAESHTSMDLTEASLQLEQHAVDGFDEPGLNTVHPDALIDGAFDGLDAYGSAYSSPESSPTKREAALDLDSL